MRLSHGPVRARELSAHCDRRDFASVPFLHRGTVSFANTLPGRLLHTADTFKGQSGAPVWVRPTDGSRYLVGIHLGPRIQRDPITKRRLPVTANKARHLDVAALTLIRFLCLGWPSSARRRQFWGTAPD